MVLKPLVQRTVQVARAGELSTRGLANIVYGAARSGMGKLIGRLLMAVARAAELCMGDSNAQDLSNTA